MDNKNNFQVGANRGALDTRRGEHGFTLIEVILVIVFLGVGFIVTLGAMSSGLQKSVDAELVVTAMALAEEKMEQIRNDKVTFGYQYILNSNFPPESKLGQHAKFSRSVDVVTFVVAGYKNVTVKVSRANMPDVELTTSFADY